MNITLNDLYPIAITVCFIVICWVVLRIVALVAARQIGKIKHDFASFVAARLGAVKWLTPVATGLFISGLVIPGISDSLTRFYLALFLISWTWELVDVAVAIVNFGVGYITDISGEEEDAAAYQFISRITKVVIWAVAILLVLANLGLDVSSLVAGLGIGGIALALAVQSVLGDLISSLSIVTDKPFQVGDLIEVDDLQGVVEHIGVRSTRIRTLDNTLVVIPNLNLARNAIKSYGRFKQRESKGVLWIDASTDSKLIADSVAIVNDVLGAQKFIDKATISVYLSDVTTQGVKLDWDYKITTTDQHHYYEARQAVIVKMLTELQAAGIKLAQAPKV